jgi:hypothetical protein
MRYLLLTLLFIATTALAREPSVYVYNETHIGNEFHLGCGCGFGGVLGLGGLYAEHTEAQCQNNQQAT